MGKKIIKEVTFMIDIALLGTGGGMPMINRYLSASLINYRGRKILIDCGEGTQVSMRILGWGFKSIDVICITHGHGDHTVGLPGLLATIGNSGRIEPLTIVGPEGIEAIVNGLRVIAKYLPYEVNIIENMKQINLKVNKENMIVAQDKEVSDITINTMEVDHSTECLAYSFLIKRQARFNIEKAKENNVPKNLWNLLQKGETIELEGKFYTPNMVLGEERKGIKLSYVTDTRPVEEIKEFIKESDLFICEGTYGNDEDIEKAIKNKHMTFREAATLAKEGNVKELLLTHFSPAMLEPEIFIDNAKSVFDNSTIGYDRIVKELKFIDK